MYDHILHFTDTSVTSLTESTIVVTAETITFTHTTTISAFIVAYATAATSTYSTTSTTTTTTNNNNNNSYFIKLSGISQGDPMEGFPQ